jgi:hypothetical protein
MSAILTAARLLPIGAQLAIVLGIAAAAGGGFLAWRSGIFNQGVAYERAEQKERDDEARAHGRAGRNAVDDCYDLGGVWDVKVGKCRR